MTLWIFGAILTLTIFAWDIRRDPEAQALLRSPLGSHFMSAIGLMILFWPGLWALTCWEIVREIYRSFRRIWRKGRTFRKLPS